jgi:hypothetical protein
LTLHFFLIILFFCVKSRSDNHIKGLTNKRDRDTSLSIAKNAMEPVRA